MPAFGAGGPSESHAALGPTMEASIGVEHMIGYAGGPPIGSGTAYLDPIGGLFGAAAVLTALVGRGEGGGGAAIEIAQREAALHYFGEWMLEAEHKGIDRLRLGNVRPGRAPHGAFPCAGDDEWVAISVHDDGEWSSLAGVIGGAELAADPRFSSIDGRSRNRGELDDLVSAWTSKKEKATLARTLQEAGVRAAPVCSAVDLATDEELRRLGFFTVLEHAEVGPCEYPGLPFHLPATPGRMRTAAPGSGSTPARCSASGSVSLPGRSTPSTPPASAPTRRAGSDGSGSAPARSAALNPPGAGHGRRREERQARRMS